MTDLRSDERSKLADLLLRGEPLPLDYRHLLFPPDRNEYELVYVDKEREEDVLADTMSVPLQPVREFGKTPNGDWRNSLIFGDNLQAMKKLLEMKEAGDFVTADGQPGIQTIYIDPPFASQRDFGGAKDERAYQDKVIGAEFLEFLRKRLIFLRELLAPTGSIFVHLDSKKGHYVKILLDEVFGEQNFRNEIVWHYYNKFQGNVNRFASDHDVIFWYSRSSSYRFTPLKEKRIEGPVRQIRRTWDKDAGRIVNVKGPDGKVVYQETEEKTVDDVWRLSMLHLPTGRKISSTRRRSQRALLSASSRRRPSRETLFSMHSQVPARPVPWRRSSVGAGSPSTAASSRSTRSRNEC